MNGLPDTTPTNRAGPRWFLRGVAVLVGLANLVVVGIRMFGLLYPSSTVWEEVTLNEALAPVLVAVLSGLATAEILPRVFRRELSSERFGQRYGAVVLGVLVGMALMGGLLAAVFALQALANEPLTLAVLVASVVSTSFYGVVVGGMLGLVEGVVLAFPLAYILGRFRNGG